MCVLVTGAAGFFGMHACRHLLDRGDEVLGIDNLDDYYDPALKQGRLRQLNDYARLRLSGHSTISKYIQYL